MMGDLTPRQCRAVVLLAQGETQKAVAAAIGVRELTVYRWLKDAAFAVAVQSEAHAITAAIRAEGIANRQNRIDAYNDRWDRMKRVIDERAADESIHAPGARTGLIVRTWKQLGAGAEAQFVEEFTVDTGLLKQLLDHEKQAAQELGQWTEKRETSGGLTVRVVYEDADDQDAAAPRPAATDRS